MMTLKNFNKIPYGKIFDSGYTIDNRTGVNMSNSDKRLKWVAKKGGGDDWAIYIYWDSYTENEVADTGDKVTMKHHIQKLVDCDDDVFNRYRY